MANAADIFAEANLLQKQLLDQLATAPIVDLLGVVSPNGVTGGRSRGEELWTLRLAFDAWRIHGGGVETRRLTVRRKVTDQELAQFRGVIRPYMVIRIRARVVSASACGGPEALLETFVGREDSDAELNAHAIQLQKPVNCEDPVFGTFTLDRRIDWFTGSAVWKGGSVALHLSARAPAEVQAALTTAHRLWQTQDGWDQRIRDCAARILLPLKNESWLGEDEAEVTADQFKQRMKLESITVHPDGSLEFSHTDGDLFWVHSIQVTGTISEGPTDAEIAG
ncbi:MAG TPA: DUF2262 domain-containing protein [Candidatus Binatia bacterium]|jgi:hypothetical protein|nr:DUF2262 domain-containing protein [Candidatus Binatia bacterium]